MSSELMYSFQTLRTVYNTFKQEKDNALKLEHEAITKEYMEERNCSEKVAKALATRDLEHYINMDAPIREHFDHLIGYYDQYQRDNNKTISNIELTQDEWDAVGMFEEFYEDYLADIAESIKVKA